jgi:hypothetical protein
MYSRNRKQIEPDRDWITATQCLGSFFAYDGRVLAAYCLRIKEPGNFDIKCSMKSQEVNGIARSLIGPWTDQKKKEWLVICRSLDSKDLIAVVDIKNTLSNYNYDYQYYV